MVSRISEFVCVVGLRAGCLVAARDTAMPGGAVLGHSHALGIAIGLALLGASPSAVADFQVVGYVPDYRFSSIDWDGAVQRTTHLVLFSLEPTADGKLEGLGRLSILSYPTSNLMQALQRASTAAPNVLVAIGGAGRSTHFPALAAAPKARKRLAGQVVKLMKKFPVVAGIDFDWEVPADSEQWRDFGKLAKEVRAAVSREIEVGSGRRALLTMTYHPLTQAVPAFAAMKSKASGTPFVDLFDLCHVMAYFQLDAQKRHSTQLLAKTAIQEWLDAGLPPGRLTLGLPFFGVDRDTTEPSAWSDIAKAQPSLKTRTSADETEGGVYFNNAETLAKKIRYAHRQGLAGVMIWELGHDTASSDAAGGSLLRHVHQAVLQARSQRSQRPSASRSSSEERASTKSSARGSYFSQIPWTVDTLIAVLAGHLGFYFFIQAVFFATPVHKRAPRCDAGVCQPHERDNGEPLEQAQQPPPERAPRPDEDGAAADGEAAE